MAKLETEECKLSFGLQYSMLRIFFLRIYRVVVG